MKQCGGNRFCCMGNSTCDCASTSLFELDSATFVTTLPLSKMFSTSTSSPASASASATSASQSTSSVASSSSSAQPSPQPSSHRVAIGAGVGVGVGIPLLAAVGVLAWYLHRKLKPRDVALHQQPSYPIEEVKESTRIGYAQMGSANEPTAERRYEMDTANASHEIDGTPKYQRQT